MSRGVRKCRGESTFARGCAFDRVPLINESGGPVDGDGSGSSNLRGVPRVRRWLGCPDRVSWNGVLGVGGDGRAVRGRLMKAGTPLAGVPLSPVARGPSAHI